MQLTVNNSSHKVKIRKSIRLVVVGDRVCDDRAKPPRVGPYGVAHARYCGRELGLEQTMWPALCVHGCRKDDEAFAPARHVGARERVRLAGP